MRIPRHESYQEKDLLEFQLGNGMGQLATLQHLNCLIFDDLESRPYIPQMGKNEVVWMLYHWKSLKIVCGKLNSNPSEDLRLKDAFAVLGVGV
jgi:hypothetical protein